MVIMTRLLLRLHGERQKSAEILILHKSGATWRGLGRSEFENMVTGEDERQTASPLEPFAAVFLETVSVLLVPQPRCRTMLHTRMAGLKLMPAASATESLSPCLRSLGALLPCTAMDLNCSLCQDE